MATTEVAQTKDGTGADYERANLQSLRAEGGKPASEESNLDRLAGEPLDVLVNNTLIAHGEVVVVNDKFGIRLTDVVSPAERVKKLR